jgi:hypothetical protein
MVSELINANPIVYEKNERRARSAPSDYADEYAVEPIDQQEVFDILVHHQPSVGEHLNIKRVFENFSTKKKRFLISFPLTYARFYFLFFFFTLFVFGFQLGILLLFIYIGLCTFST